jgi:hypothetical protein
MIRLLQSVFRFEEFENPDHRVFVRIGLFMAAAAVALRLFFWWYTDRIWEDALITVLHSENFGRGLGLTHFRVGQEPLHGFTSPISVLVPLMADAFHPGWGIHLIRLVSAFVGGLTVLYAMAIALHPKVNLSKPIAFLFMGYVAYEHCQILWGMSGMETQMVTCIILMSIYYAIAWKPVALGVSLGLCMLARPDFGFWTLVVAVYILYVDRKQFVKIVAVAMALYVPWLIFTTLYYGSPIPNTILAKSAGFGMWWVGKTDYYIWNHALGIFTGDRSFNSLTVTLGPTFPGHGAAIVPVYEWSPWVARFMSITYLLGCFRIIKDRNVGMMTVLGFSWVYMIYYIFFVPVVFGWYLVPYTAVNLLIIVYGLQYLFSVLPKWKGFNTKLRLTYAVSYVALICFVLPWTFTWEKWVQEDIENEVRVKMGKYMNEIMGPNETLTIECLGYMSYYSQRTIWDWPGLCSRTVVEYYEDHEDPEDRSLGGIMKNLKPDYIVLRAVGNWIWEINEKWIDEEYVRIKRFQAPQHKLTKIPWLQSNIDINFFVLKRKDIVKPEDIEWHGEPVYVTPEKIKKLTG